RMGRVAGTREFVVEGVPFVVIYRQIGSDQLQLIRVLHDAQQWLSAN
ncbi:MAG: plasmid stabilization system protein ParE, partial [Halioglobus sp.]